MRYCLITLLLFFTVVPNCLASSIVQPKDYVEEAKADFNNGNWTAGKSRLDKGLTKYPEDSDIWYMIGRYYYHFNNHEKARYNLTKAVELNYNNADAKLLLSKVEEETGQYSSAICHINELLETYPYRKEYWIRKANLYGKLGNLEQSELLFKRINRVFPGDTTIMKHYLYSIEASYYDDKKSGNIAEATEKMEELSHENPENMEYSTALINLYLQQGQKEKALEITDRCLYTHPHDFQLIKKKIGILSSMKRYPEASGYMDDLIKTNKSATTMQLYYDLLQESAISAKNNDPYVIYGKIYSLKKDKDALDYLLTTSLTRGYDEDARYYLKEAKRYYGETPDLLYKEYLLEKKTGNEKRAESLLQKIYNNDPGYYDAAYELNFYKMKEADRLMTAQQWGEAVPYLRFITNNKITDNQVKFSAYDKLISCYSSMRKYNAAMSIADSLHAAKDSSMTEMYYVNTKAEILSKCDRTDEAMTMYENAIDSSASPEQRAYYKESYEEIAVPYIRDLNQNGSVKKANSVSKRLLHYVPTSDQGLRYAINTSNALGQKRDYERYVNIGYGYYPEIIFYKVKKASLLDSEQQHREAAILLKPYLDGDLQTDELVKANSSASMHWAESLIKKHKPDSALVILDSALVYDFRSKDLKYTKGLAFEENRQYDSAYVFQSKNYEPTLLELDEFKQHLRGLANKAYRNEIGLEYIRTRIGDLVSSQNYSSIAAFSYSRRTQNDTYTGRIYYKGMEGNYKTALENQEDSLSGGAGVQLQAEWEHHFDDVWTGDVCVGWSDRYFSKYMGNIGVSAYLGKDWEAALKLGYRRIRGLNMYKDGDSGVTIYDGENDLWILTPSISKTLGIFWGNAQLDLFYLDKQVYYNTSVRARIFPIPDGRTSITAMAGIGSFPELTLFDLSLLQSVSHTNTMVGVDFQWLLTKNIAIGFTNTWFNHYNPYYSNNKLNSSYKNLYNADVQLHISF
jgi:tetratricopeptide (TPR) repeat protein